MKKLYTKLHQDKDTNARIGLVELDHGVVETPA